MQVIVNVPDDKWVSIQNGEYCGILDAEMYKHIKKGTPLPKVVADLQTELLMNVDGGTDDKYVRTCDVIDRIEKTIQEFMDVLDGKGG